MITSKINIKRFCMMTFMVLLALASTNQTAFYGESRPMAAEVPSEQNVQAPASLAAPSTSEATTAGAVQPSVSNRPGMSRVVKPRRIPLGLTATPAQPLSKEHWFEIFQLLDDHADFILHHVNLDNWKAFEKPGGKKTQSIKSLDYVFQMVKRFHPDLNIFVVLSGLTDDHANIHRKANGANFGDPLVREAFKNFALYIVDRYRPKLLALGSEVNSYLKNHPEDAQNFISLHAELYDLIKRRAPEIQITTTFQYELMTGAYDGTPRWYVLDEFNDKLDLIAISTYPSPYFDGVDGIPQNYYRQLKEHTKKPIIIAESGWPSAGEGRMGGSPAEQAKFLTRFVELTSDLDLRLWCWWFPHDWSGGGYPDFFKSMGLRTSSGEPKPAWYVWQQIGSGSALQTLDAQVPPIVARQSTPVNTYPVAYRQPAAASTESASKPLSTALQAIAQMVIDKALKESGGIGGRGNTNQSSVDTSKRSTALAFLPTPPQPVTTDAWFKTYEMLKNNAEFVLHHAAVDWNEFAQTADVKTSPAIESLNFSEGMAGRYGLKMFVVVDPLTHDRTDIKDHKPGFGDAAVRSAFKNFSLYIVRRLKPKYIALASEINTYLKKHPGDVQNFVSLYFETYDLLKQYSPGTQITATFQYEGLTGTFDGSPAWNFVEQLEPKLDVLAISTYPSPFFNDPVDISADYYGQIRRHTNKSVIIAESGWPSGGEARFHGTPDKQARFVERLFELTSGLDVKLWVWWFLHDWDGEGYPDFFKTMGLLSSNGQPKPSWEAWRKIALRMLE